MARILIVDDVAVHRQKLKLILENIGHEVVGQAVDGLQAARKYDSLKPDLVMMDMIMKDNNGIVGIKKIKQSNKDAKILMVSSVSERDMVMEALEHGAHAYLLKPIEQEKVENTLRNMGILPEEKSNEELEKLKIKNKQTEVQLNTLFGK